MRRDCKTRFMINVTFTLPKKIAKEREREKNLLIFFCLFPAEKKISCS